MISVYSDHSVVAPAGLAAAAVRLVRVGHPCPRRVLDLVRVRVRVRVRNRNRDRVRVRVRVSPARARPPRAPPHASEAGAAPRGPPRPLATPVAARVD